jgi:hypothetical protein
MADGSEEARRAASGALFNNRTVVDVVLAIERIADQQDIFVTTRAIAANTGIVDSVVRPVMHRLVKAQALAAVPKSGGPRSTQYFTVGRTSTWEALLTLCSELSDPQQAETAARQHPARSPKRRSR